MSRSLTQTSMKTHQRVTGVAGGLKHRLCTRLLHGHIPCRCLALASVAFSWRGRVSVGLGTLVVLLSCLPVSLQPLTVRPGDGR